jgi:hypothetical protein
VILYDVAVATHRLLDEHGLTHGFGGALALNYYADPRSTLDVDVNIFVPWTEGLTLVPIFEALGYLPVRPLAAAVPISGIRLVKEGEPILVDLFFSIDEGYREVAERLRWFPFGPSDETLPFLSAEDVVLFKLSFNRDKDWVDIRRMLEERPDLDLDYVERALIEMRGPTMYPRMARVRTVAIQAGSSGGD